MQEGEIFKHLFLMKICKSCISVSNVTSILQPSILGHRLKVNRRSIQTIPPRVKLSIPAIVDCFGYLPYT